MLHATVNGDSEAFGEFYRRHALTVERWLRAETSDVTVAADLTAETFAQALVSLRRFRGASDAEARAWLYGIARNLLRRQRRRRRVELATCRKLGVQVAIGADELNEVEQQMDAAEHAAELNHVLGNLPSNQQRAVRLHVVDGLDYSETAALMGTTEQNARTRVSRALRTLAARLKGSVR